MNEFALVQTSLVGEDKPWFGTDAGAENSGCSLRAFEGRPTSREVIGLLEVRSSRAGVIRHDDVLPARAAVICLFKVF